MRGVGKVNVAPRDAFPPFPPHYVPCRPAPNGNVRQGLLGEQVTHHA